MNIFKTAILLLSLVYLAACGHKKKIEEGSTVNLSFPDNGMISQPGTKKIEQRRLFFSYSSDKNIFAGSQLVNSYEVVNVDSLPEDQRGNYYGLGLFNSNEELVHKGLIPKDYYWKSFEKKPEYNIVHTKGTFFIDVPMVIDLSDVTKFGVVNLENNKVHSVNKIDDVTRVYQRIQRVEGWNKELFIHRIYGNSNPQNSFDFVLLTEGYTKEELQADTKDSLLKSKFGQYVQKYFIPILETEPYKSRKDNINIWVVATPSKDSGASNPFRNKDLRTVYRATFGGNCMERALIVRDQVRALEMASQVPFDQIIVLVNDEKRGGTGADITTFSVYKKDAPYIIKHELAHAVGMMADEYKYRFDVISESTCKNSLVESYGYNINKNWGRNSYHENQYYLAPNITNIADPKKVKWKNFLNENSPVVYFNYPEAGLEFDEEKNRFKGKYRSQFDRETTLITMGPSSSLNSTIELIKSIIVNGNNEDFRIYKKGEQLFIELTNFPLKKDQEVNLELELEEIDIGDGLNYIKFMASSYHTVTMPSRDFTGEISEIGIFQGSAVDLYKTFRSSYNSVMNSTNNLRFNLWQEYSYGQLIDRYLLVKPKLEI